MFFSNGWMFLSTTLLFGGVAFLFYLPYLLKLLVLNAKLKESAVHLDPCLCSFRALYLFRGRLFPEIVARKPDHRTGQQEHCNQVRDGHQSVEGIGLKACKPCRNAVLTCALCAFALPATAAKYPGLESNYSDRKSVV